MDADTSPIPAQVTGGLRAGTYNATWPLAKLTVTRDRLQIDAPGRTVTLSADEVIGYRKLRMGLQIYHTQPSPIPLVFWGRPQGIGQALTSVDFRPAAVGPVDRYHDASLRGMRLGMLALLGFFLVLQLLPWLAQLGSRHTP